MMKRRIRQSVASTEGMVDYDRNSYIQDQMARSQSELLRAAVERIGPVVPEFTVMDYGCGPGHSALNAVAPVIGAYRRIDPRGAIVIRHSDQAGNDWNARFALLFGADGYQRNESRIRTEAVPGSFYTRLAAPGSVALGTCFSASHWLSRAPSPYSPGTVWFRRPGRRRTRGIRGTRPGRLDAVPTLPCRGAAARREAYRLDLRQRSR
jgi:hypothetical protein